jgi:hypothetical protein
VAIHSYDDDAVWKQARDAAKAKSDEAKAFLEAMKLGSPSGENEKEEGPERFMARLRLGRCALRWMGEGRGSHLRAL